MPDSLNPHVALKAATKLLLATRRFHGSVRHFSYEEAAMHLGLDTPHGARQALVRWFESQPAPATGTAKGPTAG